MKSMLKDAGILFAITLVAGLLLGCVYQITKEPIARQEALAQENACREVSMPVRRQRMRLEQYLVMC